MWEELRALGMVVRPFDGPSPTPERRPSAFSASWGVTVDLLARELEYLRAERPVLELAVTESDLRLDGFPRATARLAHDGVRLSMETRYGPLRYETATFSLWRDNVRAIALSLEALRKVDRYGVSKRGEQYRGWRELPTGTDPADSIASREQAWEFLSQWAQEVGDDLDVVLRRAIKTTHPDTGGDPTEFRKVMRAKEVLGA